MRCGAAILRAGRRPASGHVVERPVEEVVPVMTARTRRWVTGALTAALLVLGAGTAAATPGAGPGAGIGYANALLYGPVFAGAGGAESLFSAYHPAGVPGFARGEVFIGGYECTTEGSVPAEVTQLESARAAGPLVYDCASPEGSVRGHALVHLTWTGRGEVTEHSWTDDAGCRVVLQVRAADVTGGMLVVVPGAGVAVLRLNSAEDADLRQERTVC